MQISPTPSAFRRLLREAEVDPAEGAPPEGLFTACDKALRSFEQAASQAVGRIRAVAEARREVAPGEWNDAALSQIRHLARLIKDVWAVLDNDNLPKDEVKAVREGLKALADERQSPDRLAAAPRIEPGRVVGEQREVVDVAQVRHPQHLGDEVVEPVEVDVGEELALQVSRWAARDGARTA